MVAMTLEPTTTLFQRNNDTNGIKTNSSASKKEQQQPWCRLSTGTAYILQKKAGLRASDDHGQSSKTHIWKSFSLTSDLKEGTRETTGLREARAAHGPGGRALLPLPRYQEPEGRLDYERRHAWDSHFFNSFIFFSSVCCEYYGLCGL